MIWGFKMDLRPYRRRLEGGMQDLAGRDMPFSDLKEGKD